MVHHILAFRKVWYAVKANTRHIKVYLRHYPKETMKRVNFEMWNHCLQWKQTQRVEYDNRVARASHPCIYKFRSNSSTLLEDHILAVSEKSPLLYPLYF